MRLDRDRQREILQALAAVYPSETKDFIRRGAEQEDYAQLWYLREHGLISSSMKFVLSGGIQSFGASITAKGLDFLADDGGLSAILGVVTVKLHADTIRDLLLSRIEQTALPVEKKSWLKTSIETMSAEALKELVKSLVKQGLEAAPDLLALTQAAIESVIKR